MSQQTREYRVGDFVVVESKHGGWNVAEICKNTLGEGVFVVMESNMTQSDAIQYAERLRKLVCGEG